MSQFFVYLAAIFIINSLVQSILRRFKVADFISHILTGVLVAFMIWFFGASYEFSSPGNTQQSYTVTSETVTFLQQQLGDSTEDGKIYLKVEEECLAACSGGPMMQVDHVYYTQLTPDKVDEILDALD